MARLHAERASAVSRHAGERLFRRQAKQRARHVDGEKRRTERRGTRVVIGSDGERHIVPAQRFDRRRTRFAQEVEGARQQHRDAPGPRHGLYAPLIAEFQMVGRKRPVPCRKRRAAELGQLVSVQLHRQAERFCLPEHSGGLARIKSNALAEHVHRVDQLLLHRRGSTSSQTNST